MTNDLPPLRGLRHLALRVRDISKAKEFYIKFFGMKVIWEPDLENCYLSSGTDNLALHQSTDKSETAGNSSPLDHFGFIAETPAAAPLVASETITTGSDCRAHVSKLKKTRGTLPN